MVEIFRVHGNGPSCSPLVTRSGAHTENFTWLAAQVTQHLRGSHAWTLARMAELVDAGGCEPSDRKVVRVRIPVRARASPVDAAGRGTITLSRFAAICAGGRQSGAPCHFRRRARRFAMDCAPCSAESTVTGGLYVGGVNSLLRWTLCPQTARRMTMRAPDLIPSSSLRAYNQN
jgi:hypothetical protein